MEWQVIFDAVREFVSTGGYTMAPLLLCSVLALIVIIERSFALRRRHVIAEPVLVAVDRIKGTPDAERALTVCGKLRGHFANIICHAIRNRHLSKRENAEELEFVGRQEASHLERGLVILEIVAGVAPLLGLLGTVLGMVQIFGVISEEGLVGQTPSLSEGISKALITTVAGLIVAIPSLVCHSYFSRKVDELVLEMEQHCHDLLGRLYGTDR